MSTEDKVKWFERAVKFVLDKDVHLVMKSRKEGSSNWAILDTKKNSVLNSNLEWEDELPVKKRDDSFLIRTRFSFENAVSLYEQFKMFAV